jgi:dTDP-glucose pyrophosphorylase
MQAALRDGVLKPVGSSVKDLTEAMDRIGLGAMVLVGRDGLPAGLFTDMDLRRAMAREGELPPLEGLIERDFATLPEGASPKEVSDGLARRRARYAVALDGAGRASGLFVAAKPEFEAVIMAGGVGSRLRPFTLSVPKPLLMVGDSPILALIIKHLVKFGIRRVHLAVNYFSEKIKEYFRDGSNHGIEIRYLEEREAQGTAGALRELPRPPGARFLVMNGDLLTGLNIATLLDVHESEGAGATIAMVPHRFEIPYGVLAHSGMRLTGLREKPTEVRWINAGIYMVEGASLDAIPKTGPVDMPTFLELLLARGDQVSVFPMRESWLDIGQLENYQRAVESASIPKA